MSILTAATTIVNGPVPGAAELAARIPVPRRLPPRYDGQPLRHLSPSSYRRFVLCPEDWRRHYLLGQRFPATGAMFLGRRVDDTLTLHYRHLLDGGAPLTLDQLRDAYRDRWAAELDAEANDRGIRWEDDLDEHRGFQLGLDALELTFTELVPQLGRPVAVQRRLEFAIAPQLEWTVQCFLDLESIRTDGEHPVAAVVDYKVKTTPLTKAKADGDPQAGLYLAGRWLQGDPADEFCFAQIAKPGPRRKQISASLVSTTRTLGQLRGVLARIAQAASQIAACHERFGPEAPWAFADPTGWKCTPRYCSHHARCPGGAGL
jgi:hypothetical protein